MLESTFYYTFFQIIFVFVTVHLLIILYISAFSCFFHSTHLNATYHNILFSTVTTSQLCTGKRVVDKRFFHDTLVVPLTLRHRGASRPLLIFKNLLST